MILTRDKIKEEIKKGNISITPFNIKNLGAASYDLTLDNKFRVFIKDGEFKVNNNSDYKKITKSITVKDYYTLKPGEFILGITKERIKLNDNIAGFLTGRTRFARLGLLVHITANFVQPGVNNKQVLEIKNVSNRTFKLYPGTKLLQIIFVRCKGNANYKGKFKEQLNP